MIVSKFLQTAHSLMTCVTPSAFSTRRKAWTGPPSCHTCLVARSWPSDVSIRSPLDPVNSCASARWHSIRRPSRPPTVPPSTVLTLRTSLALADTCRDRRPPSVHRLAASIACPAGSQHAPPAVPAPALPRHLGQTALPTPPPSAPKPSHHPKERTPAVHHPSACPARLPACRPMHTRSQLSHRDPTCRHQEVCGQQASTYFSAFGNSVCRTSQGG